MNTFYRVVGGAAAILIGLGVLLGGIGFLLGGRMTQMPVAGVAFTGWGYNPLWGQDTVETSYPDGSVRKLDFELTCMDVQILEGDGFWIRAENVDGKRFSTYQDGDTWKIRCDNKHLTSRKPIVGRNWEHNAPQVTITVPRDFVVEELDLELGMGTLTMDGVTTWKSDLEVGMGSMTLTGFTSSQCDVDVGMGSLVLNGKITGKGDIKCGMGSIEMTLGGREEDYGCRATVGMGTVILGSESTGGMDGEMTRRRDAPNFFNIDCGMGSVEIYFTE